MSWWAAEGNAADSLGTNNGTLQGGAAFSTGIVGQAFSLNGTSQYVLIPNNPSLTPSGSFTFELWINPSQSGIEQTVAGKFWDNEISYNIDVTPGLGIGFGISDAANENNGPFQVLVTTNNAVSLGAWSHVAGVYDQSTGTRHIYVNGVEMTNRTQTPITIFNGNSPLVLGAIASAGGASGQYFGGLIDEVSYYNRALSAAEIMAIYNAGSAGKCPAPLLITSQPQSQTVFGGSTVSLSVGAGGSPPLSYQWFQNETNLPVATNATLVLTNVQVAEAGSYSVTVTNFEGTTNSSNAVLTVLAPGDCYPPPSGLVAWWPGERSAIDIAGTNNGTLQGGVTFTNGKVGQAFQFDGATGYVTMPASSSLNVGTNVGLTIECWINPANISADQTSGIALVNWGGTVIRGVRLGIFGNPNSFFASVDDTLGGQHPIGAPANTLHVGVYQHLALTYDKASGVATLYYNGAEVASQVLGSFTPLTDYPLYIGKYAFGLPSYYAGSIDEVSVYGRALSAQEIADIYAAGTTGKCSEPVIAVTPQNQVGYWGNNIILSVDASGSGPFSYQWDFNNAPIANATNALLILDNLQFTNAGYYTVVISNSYGSVTSAPAYLAINPAGVSLALYPGITIDGVPGLTYGIQYSTNLSNTNDWLGLVNLTLIQTNELWFDVQPATQPQRYYRVVPGPIPIP